MGKRTEHSLVYGGRALVLLTALLAVFFLFCPSGRSAAQTNPFFDTPVQADSPISVPVPRLQALIDTQRAIREVLADAVDRSASGASGVIALLGLAFVYGLLHALGPGHRKIALAAYFVARPAHPLQGVAAGASVAFLHAAAAVAIIILLGSILLVLAVRGILKDRKNTQGVYCGDGVEDGERKTLTAIVLSSGVVPCPGTALILIFCLSQNLPWVGALAALAMSVGMAIITVGVSLAAVVGKRGLLSALPRGSRLSALFHHSLEIGGAVLIVIFGLLMLSPYLIRLPA
jgi:nickel/cobalt exporter